MPSRSACGMGGWRGACWLPAEVLHRRQAAASPVVPHPWLQAATGTLMTTTSFITAKLNCGFGKLWHLKWVCGPGPVFQSLWIIIHTAEHQQWLGNDSWKQRQINLFPMTDKTQSAVPKVPPLITSGGRLSDTDWNRKRQHRRSRWDKRRYRDIFTHTIWSHDHKWPSVWVVGAKPSVSVNQEHERNLTNLVWNGSNSWLTGAVSHWCVIHFWLERLGIAPTARGERKLISLLPIDASACITCSHGEKGHQQQVSVGVFFLACQDWREDWAEWYEAEGMQVSQQDNTHEHVQPVYPVLHLVLDSGNDMKPMTR